MSEASTETQAGLFTAADYDDAIQRLTAGREQLEPDGRNCAICGDTDHQAWECRFNPLVCEREVVELRGSYRCYHCGLVFTDRKSAVEHFGVGDPGWEGPACIADLQTEIDRLREAAMRLPEIAVALAILQTKLSGSPLFVRRALVSIANLANVGIAAAGEPAGDECRRCSECRGMTHHWMENLEAEEEGEFVCKHCGQVGIACKSCDVAGCDVCNREGVVPVVKQTSVSSVASQGVQQ